MDFQWINTTYRIVSIICAGLLFLAVFNLPIEYYIILRIVVFMGALLMILARTKSVSWILVFIVIAFLFNPVYPFYLYQKSKWIPIDIIAGILFLWQAFVKEKESQPEKSIGTKEQKTHSRDRIL